MEEDEEVTLNPWRSRNSIQPSIYRSTQTSLNRDSQQSLYQSVRGTLYEDAMSLHSAASTGTLHSACPEDASTLRDEDESMIEGSCDGCGTDEVGGEPRRPSYYDAEASLYFRDGTRTVTFVLVWDDHDKNATSYKSVELRRTFEKYLVKDGLELEYERPEPNGLRFIKIHAPREVLRRYSEILKLRMPMKEVPYLKESVPRKNIMKEMNSIFQKMMKKYYVDTTIFPTYEHRFTALYSRDKEYLFDLDMPEFFSPGNQARIVQFILDRTKFTDDEEDDFAFGIDRLINESAYVAAYPLHDGDLYTATSMRYFLYKEWASVRKCLHYQPLDYIKEYFGVKIGLYFAWLGFYTQMLIPASIVGLLCFIYSCLTLYSNRPSEEICNGKESIMMCPLCDEHCSCWDLRDTCTHARITYLFDNPATVFFAIFMSFWATLFLELWKRYSAEITHRWDLTGLDIQEEHPRPQYLARLQNVKKKSHNAVTDTEEPRVSYWKMKLPATILSFSVVLLLIAVAMAAVLGVVLYRMSVMAAFSFRKNPMLTSNAILFTTATAACINLCCIFLFNWVYMWLAEYLTEVELLRTQSEFDDSLTLKMYLLQFVNYYASIFYIAFFKGKFVGYPGAYNRIFNFRQEECGPGGCLMELCIQLSIIMVGKQAMNTVLEMLFPLFYKWLNTIKVHVGAEEKDGQMKRKSSSRMILQWMKDYKLVQWGPRSLFPEYLEMVLQYGFVTIFVAAFPLAPFFALLNNIFEMRLDAKKLLTLYRRPVGQRVKDIGVWYRILDSISKLSVITNGFIIAFTSNFIPRLVYMRALTNNKTIEGYVNFSLSIANTSTLNTTRCEVGICRYQDFREPPNSENPYEHTSMFWHVLAARLAFVVVFENVVAVVMIIVRWCIPNMSQKLQQRIRREAYITNEMIIQHETLRARRLPDTILRTAQSESPDLELRNRRNRFMGNSMSNSDFELEVHGSPAHPSPRFQRNGSSAV